MSDNLPTPALRALCSWGDANGDYCDMRRADCLAVLRQWDSEPDAFPSYAPTLLAFYRSECGPDVIPSLLRRYSEMLAGAAFSTRTPE